VVGRGRNAKIILCVVRSGWFIRVREHLDAGLRRPRSKARLALALLLYIGQRRSDVVTFGRQHIKSGWITFTQAKNRKRKPITLSIPVRRELKAIIDASPSGNLTFLVTAFGKPFTANGFGNWFREPNRTVTLHESRASRPAAQDRGDAAGPAGEFSGAGERARQPSKHPPGAGATGFGAAAVVSATRGIVRILIRTRLNAMRVLQIQSECPKGLFLHG
jgi:hypothetical protein